MPSAQQPLEPTAVDLRQLCLVAARAARREYGWRLGDADLAQLADQAATRLAAAPEATVNPSRARLEVCRAYFAALYDGLRAGKEAATFALQQLYTPGDAVEATPEAGFLGRYCGAQLRRLAAQAGVPLVGAALADATASAAAAAWAAIGTKYAQCHDRDTFLGWCTKIAQRAAIDEWRQRSRTAHHELPETAPSAEPEPDLDRAALFDEVRRKLRIGELEWRDGAVIQGYLEELGPRELAPRLSKQLGTVVTENMIAVWKRRAVAILMRNLRASGVID